MHPRELPILGPALVTRFRIVFRRTFEGQLQHIIQKQQSWPTPTLKPQTPPPPHSENSFPGLPQSLVHAVQATTDNAYTIKQQYSSGPPDKTMWHIYGGMPITLRVSTIFALKQFTRKLTIKKNPIFAFSNTFHIPQITEYQCFNVCFSTLSQPQKEYMNP